MNKIKIENLKKSPDMIKEYQDIVRKLQEELYTMKNSMAIQDETIKKLQTAHQLTLEENTKSKLSLKYANEQISVKNELIENYEIELKNLYSALKDSEENAKSLIKEIELYKDSLNTDSLLEITNHATTLGQKIEAHKNLRRSAEFDADFYKTELEAKTNEIYELNDLLSAMKNEQKIQLRKEELQKIILSKDEQMKKMNLKFQVMNHKIDMLTKEKDSLEVLNKNLETEKKKLTERWKQSSTRNKEDTKIVAKNKKMEEELMEYKLEIETAVKKYQDLYMKYTSLVKEKDNDMVYINKLKEEIVRTKTNMQVLISERDVLSKINEEISVNNHIKQIENVRCRSSCSTERMDRDSRPSYNKNLCFESMKPTNTFLETSKFTGENSDFIENKLRNYESTIAALRFQLQQRVGCYKTSIDKFSKKDTAAQTKENSLEHSVCTEEIQNLLEDFQSLLEKHKKCKNKKHILSETNAKLIEKVQILSSQVQSDHFLILHLQGRTPTFNTKASKEPQKSNKDLHSKHKSFNPQF
ncbi:hypothetical protein SteCoe_27977 [Stentor coeruleus]|uniref:Uncharacterized protein n=1 Tax=Stentor coeruleus TaxID=5963 RepID=A0A1R2B9T1_9CILI|nr:hypothetical protein SteCoe_27977 [Stentor coeruleus]